MEANDENDGGKPELDIDRSRDGAGVDPKELEIL